MHVRGLMVEDLIEDEAWRNSVDPYSMRSELDRKSMR
jgi:hypothetical protein